MKTIWTILHLDTPTTDINQIKDAYSKLTKTCNPEENPEEFQELHNAYKQAIQYAKNVNRQNKDNTIEFEKQNKEDEKISYQKTEFSNLKKEENLNKKEIEFKENNDFEVFKGAISNESEEIKIRDMMLKIDFGFAGDKKDLKKVLSSSEFQNLMRSENFQLALSKYLNNNRKLDKSKVLLLQKYGKQFLKRNYNIKVISSLKNYFTKYRPKTTLSPTYYIVLGIFTSYCIISGYNMTDNTKNMNIGNISNYDFTSFNRLNENELDYSLGKKIILNYPENFTLEFNSDYTKRLEKEDTKIKIQTRINLENENYYSYLQEQSRNDIEEYSYKKSELSEIEEFELNNITYYCATTIQIPSYSTSEIIEKYVWTNLDEKHDLCFCIINPDNISQEELNMLLDIEIEDTSDTNTIPDELN